MPRRVETQFHTMVGDLLAVFQRIQPDIAQPCTQDAGTRRRGQVMTTAVTGMVTMGMRNDGPVYRPPGVNIEVAGRAVETLGPGNDEIHVLRTFKNTRTRPPGSSS